MNTFLLLIAALTTQETLFSHAAIFMARSSGISWVLIHFIWVVITLIHLVLPYLLGKFLSKKVRSKTFTSIVKKLEKYASLDNSASALLYFVLGIFNFVYINSFLLAFLKVDIKRPMIYIFLGDLLWYVLVASSTLLGVNILSSLQTLFFAIMVTLVFGFVGGEVVKKIKRR